MGQFFLHLLFAYIFAKNKTCYFNLNTAWFLFLQAEVVDGKCDKCEAFATGETA